MSSDDSDAGPHQKRKRKSRRSQEGSASTSSSGSPLMGPSTRSRRRPFTQRCPVDSTDSESDSGSTIHRFNKRKKVGRVASDSDSSGSTIVIRTKRTGRIPSESDVYSEVSDRGFENSSSSQWETDISETEMQSPKPKAEVTATVAANIDSDSSDGQSEKCPICLVSFKTQEIGTPEACDHMFCLECIQEWSKNINTCPVDRQEYSLILVRKNIEGKVIKQIPVEKPVPQNDDDIVEDPTFCEICGGSDNEDRMLLCDSCDLGFHLYCLTPPLTDVPAGPWFCNECSPDDDFPSDIELVEIQLLLDEAAEMGRPQGRRRSRLSRLVPRTRQSERVRRRIANNRQQNSHVVDQAERPTTSSSLELADTVSSTTSRARRSRPRTERKPSRRRARRVRYKTVYEIDPATGETVAVKKRQRKSKRSKKSSRRAREAARPKTVKKRLATQLGICAPRSVPQSLPDVRIDTATNTLGGMRFQAGIPTLHLFGQNHELDYFSGGDDEDYYVSGSQIVIGRAPNRSDVSAMRRVARRKAVAAPSTVSSSTDLLDSILSSQELFHSKNSSYHVDSSGKFKIENKKNGYVDVNKQQATGRQRPNSYQSQGGGSSGYNTGGYYSHDVNQYHSTPTSTMESSGNLSYGGGSPGPEQNEVPQDYTQRTLCASYDPNPQERKDEENNTGTNTPNSESEIDIYSDIETVSTSKVDDGDLRPPSPPMISNTPNTGTDDDNNDSEPDMVIDDEKLQEPEKVQEYNREEAAVTSTVGFNSEYVSTTSTSVPEMIQADVDHSSMEIQSGAVQSSNLDNKNNDYDEDSTDGCPNNSIYAKQNVEELKDTEDIDSDDGCPNFSIYSKESKSVALSTDISLSAEDNPPVQQDYQVGEVSSSPNVAVPHSPENPPLENTPIPPARDSLVDKFTNPAPTDLDASDTFTTFGTVASLNRTGPLPLKDLVKGGVLGGLYSDSEDEAVVKKGGTSFDLSDINHMTEDISEEERSYTPCLDERAQRQGLEGLDTEMISDEDRNDFDESHELKTISDGDALEINAKESELDFTRPEDYEEGEIVDKNKTAKKKEEPEGEKKKVKPKKDEEVKKSKKKEKEKPTNDDDKGGNKENEGHVREAAFKKLSKNNKERNYRDKDKETEHQPSPDKSRDDKREKKREKRKELERYNVRALIADKPRPLVIKDQFGRDIRRTPSRSRSRSYTPPIRRSLSRGRKSPSHTRRSPTPQPRRSLSRPRSLSRGRKSLSKDRSRKRRARSRHRSLSRSRSPRKKRPSSKTKKRKRSATRYGGKRRKSSRDRLRTKKKSRPRRSRSPGSPRRKRDWSRRGWTPVSMSPSPEARHMSPSWTPPRLMDNTQALRNQNFTVVVDNSNKKKKDKRRKSDKRNKEGVEPRQKKRRRERERTPPPSKEVFASGDNILVSVSFNNENETRDVTTRDRRKKDADDSAKKRKERRLSKNRRDLSGIKPVAIIDLERSPFKEITPSPKDVIVLSDSDNNDNEPVSRNAQKNICDSSQQVGSPERTINYSMGPKTPPEPQIKFSLSAKPPQVRAISNPLHEPDDMENNDEVQDEIAQRINEGLHKGPNTPPEPPNSPPSSPDAYDPFEPTKSRSPTPEPMQTGQLNSSLNMEDANAMDSRTAIDMLEKCTNPPRDNITSLTPPIADIQPADSQSSIQVTPDSNLGKSPERIGVIINQTVQPALSTSKPVAQTTPFSSVPTSIITSTPVASNVASSRINILNSTILTPVHVASSIPQRIVLPNQVKSSPVKISPTKAAIKSTPIKPMPNKTNKSSSRKSRTQNAEDLNLDFDSPYSPGSSDYEDLFEPPPDNVIKPASKSASKNTTKSPQKHQSVFDALFGSPNFNFNKSKGKNDKSKFGKKTMSFGKTKTVGVKLDEDNLKILDDLPNSAVEMQVKDKFLKKLNRQERVVEEVKLVLKPHYNKKRINKEEYKDILRRAVPKICHNKSGEINPTKIKNLIEAYVKKIRHSKKVTSSSSVNPQKV